MRRYIISYSSKNYYATQDRFVKSIFDKDLKVVSYTDKWLKKTEFYKEHQYILEQKRGGGYWLWKPYILLEALNKMQEGDFVVYCDSDAIMLKPFTELFQICEKNKGIMIFDNSMHLNKTWTKRDCFILMDADTSIFHNAGQAMGGFQVFQKTEFSIAFIKDWLKYASDYRILTDAENELGSPNLPEFKEHRHDQSILSILALKYNLELFRDPSQFGNPYKIKSFRQTDDFLLDGVYYDEKIKLNSPYNTLIELGDVVVEKKAVLTKIINRVKYYLK